jgi:hypothetical protein
MTSKKGSVFPHGIDPAFFTVRTKHAHTHMRRRGESNFRIKIFEIIGSGQKGEFGEQLPEQALLTAPEKIKYPYII